MSYPSRIHREDAKHISAATRELIATLLAPTVLGKDDGAFEIGREHTKNEIRLALEYHLGEAL